MSWFWDSLKTVCFSRYYTVNAPLLRDHISASLSLCLWSTWAVSKHRRFCRIYLYHLIGQVSGSFVKKTVKKYLQPFSSRGLLWRRAMKKAIFHQYLQPCNRSTLETIQVMAIVITEDKYDLICDLLNGSIFNDFERLLTPDFKGIMGMPLFDITYLRIGTRQRWLQCAYW